jgi:cell division inhibitor SulA
MSAMQAIAEAAFDPVATTRISEFIFPGDPRQQLPLFLPVLSHLSRCGDSRWLTCIGTLFLAKKDCADFGLDWRRLLQVLPSARCDVFEITLRALAAGKSHTVVGVVPMASSQQQISLLEQAARLGDCRCILVRSR